MGKILGYYCPVCGDEYSDYYDKSVCKRCSSFVYIKYDYFPIRKKKPFIDHSYHEMINSYKDILPDSGYSFRKSSFSPRLLWPVANHSHDSGVNVFIKDEAAFTSGCMAERGLNLLIPEITRKKVVGGIFYDETVFSAVFLRNFLNLRFKILIPDYFGEEYINKLYDITDNFDIIEEDENISKLFNFDKQPLFNTFNYQEYIEGLKTVFFESSERFSKNDTIHFIIPGHRIELLLAWGKALNELTILSLIKSGKFILHTFFLKENDNQIFNLLLEQFKRQVLSLIKLSNGSVMEISHADMNVDIKKIKKRIGLPLGKDGLYSLCIDDLLINQGNIKSGDNMVCINTNHSYLDFPEGRSE